MLPRKTGITSAAWSAILLLSIFPGQGYRFILPGILKQNFGCSMAGKLTIAGTSPLASAIPITGGLMITYRLPEIFISAETAVPIFSGFTMTIVLLSGIRTTKLQKDYRRLPSASTIIMVFKMGRV